MPRRRRGAKGMPKGPVTVRPFRPFPHLMSLRNASMARRIAVLALVPTLLFIAILGGASYKVLEVSIAKGVERGVETAATHNAKSADNALRAIVEATAALAWNVIVIDALADPVSHRKYVTSLLESVATIGHDAVDIALLDTDGTILASAGPTKFVTEHRDRLVRAIKAGKPTAGMIELRVHDTFLGVVPVLGAPGGPALGAIAFRFTVPAGPKPRIGDPNATFLMGVIHGPRAALLGDAPAAEPDFDPVSGDRLTRRVPLVRDTFLAPLGLAVEVIAPAELVYGPLRNLQRVYLIAGLASVLIISVLSIIGGRRLARPIRDLEEVAAAVIVDGRTDLRVNAHGAREVVDLATTFNYMLDRLEATMNELRASEARFRSVIDRSPSAISVKDARGRYVMVNRTAAEWMGRDPALILDKTPAEILGAGLVERALDQDRRVRESGEVLVEEHEFTYADGAVRRIVVTKFPVPLRDGSEIGVGGIFTDVTEMRATADQLRHAQKMEAVGQLTGGVAHDFNNLLTVVLGNLELLRDGAGADRAGRPFIDIAIRAGERGAELTQRLLAFSRRHPLRPAATDVNAAIAGAIELIRRTLREDIALSTALDHGTWRALVDPGQLENALVNLAVNAQDAMPAGGELTIESGNVRLDTDYARRNAEVPSGDYVMIAVTDSGIGMPQDVLRRAFEPFFTTKVVGKGSGLGLSMIYGFAKQSGGHVKIYSEVGHGTTVRIYLPRLAADDEEDAPAPAAAAPARATGGETILAVEDDPDVRQYVTHALRRAGYAVLEAENGPAALEILEGGIPIDLLFTDVIMPGGMNGRDLADRAAAIRPRLKVLFSSGYSENAIIHHGRLDKGVSFLGKPYTRDDLARKVRDVLDAPHRPLARATRSQEAAVAAHR